jgi:hypothetical protein
MSGVKNAAVVKQGDRFVPVELNKSAPGPQKTDSSMKPAIGLLPRDDKAIEKARKDLADARANPDGKDLNAMQADLASKMYGLPPSSFHITNRNEGRVATTVDANGMPQGINIQNGLSAASHGDAGTHAQVGTEGEKAEGFDPKVGTAISIDGGLLDGTTKTSSIDNALGVFEHESTHLEDTQEATRLIGQWKGDFKANPEGFKSWLAGEEKKGHVSHAQALRVGQVIDPKKGNADTELHAHMATAIDAIRNGSPEVAKEQMRDYKLSTQNPDLLAEHHVLAEASKAFKSMTKEQQAQFKDALAQAGGIFKNFDPEKGTYAKQPLQDR